MHPCIYLINANTETARAITKNNVIGNRKKLKRARKKTTCAAVENMVTNDQYMPCLYLFCQSLRPNSSATMVAAFSPTARAVA